MNDGLTLLIYGGAKVGKSWFADTAPGPRLILDSEGGNGILFTPSKKTTWDPRQSAPPQEDGTWDSCIVHVHDFAQVQKAYDWLNSGQHPFNSVVIDSISEVQQRCVDSIAGTEKLKYDDWGILLRIVSDVVRRFRDLANHPTKPLRAVILIAMATVDNGRYVPYVQGQLLVRLPYYMDVCGYMMAQPDGNGGEQRFLMIGRDYRWLTGERLGGRLGPYIYIPDNDQTVTRMLDMVFKEGNP